MPPSYSDAKNTVTITFVSLARWITKLQHRASGGSVRKALLLTACGYLLAASPTLFGATATATYRIRRRQRGISSQSAIDRLLGRKPSSSGSTHRQRKLARRQLKRHRVGDPSAATTGSSQLQLSLSSSGTRIEAESGLGTNHLLLVWRRRGRTYYRSRQLLAPGCLVSAAAVLAAIAVAQLSGAVDSALAPSALVPPPTATFRANSFFPA